MSRCHSLLMSFSVLRSFIIFCTPFPLSHSKLIGKYPESIKQIEDPQQKMYKSMFDEAAKKNEKDGNEVIDDDNSDEDVDEKIEL